MLNQVYALKQQMHQEFLSGRRVPITTLTVPQHHLLIQKTTQKDGYSALVLGLGEAKKNLNKSLAGVLKKLGVELKPQKIKEVRLDKDLGEEEKFEVEEILTPGSLVTVIGTSKGKGFAGVMKRYGFRGGPRTHGQSDRERTPGSIGRGTTPGRILPGKKMPGRMGGEKIAVRNLKIVAFDPETRQLKLAGAVPGNRNSWVTLKVTKFAATN